MPQLLLNVPVAERRPSTNSRGHRRTRRGRARVSRVEGRVLLRYSGTEPLARVMVEGEDAHEIESSPTASPMPSIATSDSGWPALRAVRGLSQ